VVGVGVAFFACPGGVFLPVGVAIATAELLALCVVVLEAPAGVLLSDCCGPSHKNSITQMARVMMTPRRLNMIPPRSKLHFTTRRPVRQFVTGDRSLTAWLQNGIVLSGEFDFLQVGD
jgi:hypothetical protein